MNDERCLGEACPAFRFWRDVNEGALKCSGTGKGCVWRNKPNDDIPLAVFWCDTTVTPSSLCEKLGEQAAARLKANKHEDVETWAHRLAADLAKLKD